MVDRAGFEGFYRERHDRLVRSCALVLLDLQAAEEVAAEAFTRLWMAWERLSDDDHAGGYVYTTAMRLCSKRRARRRREPVGDALPSAATDDLAAAERRREVFAALGRLPMGQRQAVVLRDWAGFDTEDVASMMAIAESTVRVRLARGRASLRRILTDQGSEP